MVKMIDPKDNNVVEILDYKVETALLKGYKLLSQNPEPNEVEETEEVQEEDSHEEIDSNEEEL